VAADHGDAAFENVGRYVVEQRSVDVDAKRLLELSAVGTCSKERFGGRRVVA
jgi:hypothetical protein